MPSWRDFVSEQAQDDLDGLINASLPFAQQMLEAHGEFFPYGAAVDDSGETRMVAADAGQYVQPGKQLRRAGHMRFSNTELLDLLLDGLRRDRDSIRAVAVVSDVRLADSDAVRVELEHREGHAIAVLLPYKKKRRLRRGVEYGDLVAAPGEHRVWVS
ncbi:MAG TPA: hypothetical protein VGJ86_04790 [Acidimicrobiales bacterium]|jgi:hypothetical protein